MMQLSVKDVADNANMIINGYAYTKDGDYIRVPGKIDGMHM